jgi:L-gulonate 3-dehydrogenase
MIHYFTPGFLANRIQAVIVREGIHLVEKGAADVDAVDCVVRDGLGLRWALFGNFGVNNSNADGGVREYDVRFGKGYQTIRRDLDSTPPSFSPEMNERIGKGTDEMEGKSPIHGICR